MDTNNNSKIFTLTKLALSVSIMCILGPIIIPLPFSPIPISITQIGLYLSIYFLGYKLATYCTLIYILMGLIGLPVFSGYSGGLQKLTSPTGGYLIGFIFLTFISGIFIEKYTNNLYLTILGYTLGNLLCYSLGSIWLSYSTNISIKTAFIIGVIPYIFTDILKVIVYIVIGTRLRRNALKSLWTEDYNVKNRKN